MNTDKCRQELSVLLGDRDTLCVAAVMTVPLEDLSDYVEWASRVLCFADKLSDVSDLAFIGGLHCPLNLHEIRDAIRRILGSVHLLVPDGAVAVELFSLGLIRSVAAGRRAPRPGLGTLSALFADCGECEALKWFHQLEKWMRWMDVETKNEWGFPNSYDGCVELFLKRCHTIAEESDVLVREADGVVSLAVKWPF